MPRVTIGVPVYNGASLIGECLANLAEQTYRDFEVIISDNASNDGTTEICEDVVRRDPRFRMVRQENTSTAMQNFLAVRAEAQSTFFMWRAFDDLSTPNYIEALVAVHESHPGIALAAPSIVKKYSSVRRDRRIPYIAPPGGPRVAALLQQMQRMQAGWFYGLWRLEAAQRATEEVFALFPDAWGADYLALFHAALNDVIAGTNRCEFHQRILAEVRDYVPRQKPSHAEMIDANRRFSATCHALLDRAAIGALERAFARGYLPLFTNRCSHRATRVLKAALRRTKGN